MKKLATLALLLVAALCVMPAQAKTLTVGEGKTYETIGDALDDAGAKDTISVAAGYYEVPDGIEIEKKGLVLKGAGADRTILDGMGSAYAVVKANAKGVTITGFTLMNGSSHGVYVNDTNSATITYNIITANKDRGILLGMGTPYAVIDHNTFVKNDVSAIYSYRDEARTKFTNNVVAGNSRSIVTDFDSSAMTIKYNCFYDQTNDDDWAPKSKTNITKDPMFVDEDGDFHLQKGSPCLGKGADGSNIGALGTGTNPVGVAPKPKAKTSTGKYRIVIFTNDEDNGKKILDILTTAGFANDESYVSDDPNDEANIKYGAADKDDIKKIKAMVSGLYDGKIDTSDEFEEDDYDVFINLP